MCYFRFLLGLFSILPEALLAQEKMDVIKIKLDFDHPKQRIDNFGAAGCWNAEEIGKYWPEEKKARMAELLFSTAVDSEGKPRGIGLNTWRFNVGAGTAEQGDASGMPSLSRRVECFQLQDGSYDWSKQAGSIWFAKQAKAYGVKNLVAFVNSPPVHMTQNGLGYKTNEDGKSNLRPDRYGAFASYLADVVQHFSKEGVVFNYISPVNEPQWKWYCAYGDADQEGSPYTNEEIYQVIGKLDSTLTVRNMDNAILVPETGSLSYFYGGGRKNNTLTTQQVPVFWNQESSLYLGRFKHVPRVMAGHSYFTDFGDDSIINTRIKVAEAMKNHQVAYWQSEYSMLGDGFREGTGKPRSAMDCSLFLAKMIHHDLVIGQAAAWHFWNAFEPGKPDVDTRYYLLAFKSNANHTDGEYWVTKNLWALGHYSRFIEDGMRRIDVLWDNHEESNSLLKQAQDVMFSAYTNFQGKVVVVAINYAELDKKLIIDGMMGENKSIKMFITDENHDFDVYHSNESVILPKRSIITCVFNE